MTFQNPSALFLLLLLIPIIVIGRPARGYGRTRERTALILRIFIVLLLVLAAAGLEFQRGNDALAVVFLVDVSHSMPEGGQEKARRFIEAALMEMRPEDQAAVILFGADALVERTMSNEKELAAFRSVPDRSQTDFAEAVRLAMGLYPQGSVRRLVLLTDGRETKGDAVSAARLSVDSGVEFITVSIADEKSLQEITLLDVSLPARLIEGEAFDLKLTVHTRIPSQVFIRILADGAIAFEGTAELKTGTQDFNIPLIANEPGFSPFTVQIGAVDDVYYQNNQLTAFTRVEGPPKVLVAAPETGEPFPFSDDVRPDEAGQLVAALENTGFSVDLVRPGAIPFELSLLSEYASLVLVDVPARQLSERQMRAIQTFVRDLGGGLLTIGGPTAYGVGGYYRTALEETLPLDMEIKDEERRPGLAMVFIIDRSGSMSDTSSGVTKLDLAKEAATRSVDLLFPGDKIGIIAFDDTASWVVPITELDKPDEVIASIETIGIGGGTDILGGLQAMANELPQDDSQVKHVILLTDGGASPVGIPDLVATLYQENGITLTTVGVGSDAAAFLENIALIGGGRYHFTDRPETIPSIFTEETSLATRSYIVEESFFPRLSGRSPIISQITAVPPLHGYVASTAKTTAQTILVSDKGDPILASWQYGLGKAIAWTSDASSRWSRDWVAWEGFQSFWAQAIRATVSNIDTSPLTLSISDNGTTVKISLDAINSEGEFLNGYDFTGNVVSPRGTVQSIRFTQVEPGRYEAQASQPNEGAYLLRLDGIDNRTENTVSDVTGWVRPYSQEYRYLVEDPGFLQRLTLSAGGSFVTLDDSGSIFSNPKLSASAGRPLWPELLIAALLILPFDIAVRRLVVDRRDFIRAWHSMQSLFTLRKAPAAAGSQQTERMSSLFQAKDRVEKRRKQEKEFLDMDAEKTSRVPEVSRQTTIDEESLGAEKENESSLNEDSAGRSKSTTAALLARKRARQERNRQNKKSDQGQESRPDHFDD